jgi:small subunit ribosomal protein S20
LGIRDDRESHRISGEFFRAEYRICEEEHAEVARCHGAQPRAALRASHGAQEGQAPTATADERSAAISLLDRAARKGLVHKNLAARQKSHLTKAVATA